jgi:BirA family biotin operon repressor/biotin-[acetyl-CoA-carboxylase] ligase
LSWQLRRLPVCASTEIELDRWLEQRQATALPQEWLAVAARRQRFGHGQQGRPWLSPAGGLWLSAAIPWAGALPGTASLGLAVAVGLAQQLEALGLSVQLKWPNDLLVGDRKIAGLLPRLRLRGQRIRAAQVGVGLNGCNRVPPGALSVAEALGCRKGHPQASPERLLPRVLAGLEWAAFQVLRNPAPPAAAPACFATTSFTVAGLSAFTITVSCTRTPGSGTVSDGATALAFYTLVANACNAASAGTCPTAAAAPEVTYVERQLTWTVAR